MKHIKKIINYFLGRFFQVIGRHDKAVVAYSRVLRYRYFFADTQKRFAKSYRSSGGNGYLLVQGGVGDILQSLPFMLENKDFKYLIQTHFLGAKNLLSDLGVEAHELHLCSSLGEYKKLEQDLIKRDGVFMCPRAIFFEQSPFLIDSETLRVKPNTVGVHVSASAIAIQKALPDSFLIDLLGLLNRLNLEVLLFCTKSEANHFRSIGIVEKKKLKFISEEEIFMSLAQVERCALFIGSDSVFKTMSSMLKIPTFVLFHNIKNRFRDRMFINPYVKEGVMNYLEYDHFSSHEVERILSNLSSWIDRKLSSE
jgi:ADP-heptose:LPS heptosyltransferase